MGKYKPGRHFLLYEACHMKERLVDLFPHFETCQSYKNQFSKRNCTPPYYPSSLKNIQTQKMTNSKFECRNLRIRFVLEKASSFTSLFLSKINFSKHILQRCHLYYALPERLWKNWYYCQSFLNTWYCRNFK